MITKTNLKKLQSTTNSGLRTISEAFRSSPIKKINNRNKSKHDKHNEAEFTAEMKATGEAILMAHRNKRT